MFVPCGHLCLCDRCAKKHRRGFLQVYLRCFSCQKAVDYAVTGGLHSKRTAFQVFYSIFIRKRGQQPRDPEGDRLEAEYEWDHLSEKERTYYQEQADILTSISYHYRIRIPSNT